MFSVRSSPLPPETNRSNDILSLPHSDFRAFPLRRSPDEDVRSRSLALVNPSALHVGEQGEYLRLLFRHTGRGDAAFRRRHADGDAAVEEGRRDTGGRIRHRIDATRVRLGRDLYPFALLLCFELSDEHLAHRSLRARFPVDVPERVAGPILPELLELASGRAHVAVFERSDGRVPVHRLYSGEDEDGFPNLVGERPLEQSEHVLRDDANRPDGLLAALRETNVELHGRLADARLLRPPVVLESVAELQLDCPGERVGGGEIERYRHVLLTRPDARRGHVEFRVLRPFQLDVSDDQCHQNRPDDGVQRPCTERPRQQEPGDTDGDEGPATSRQHLTPPGRCRGRFEPSCAPPRRP